MLVCFFFVVCSSSPFITTWRTTSPNETVTFPLAAPLTSNLTVDWGDGVIVNFTALPVAHVYNVSGVYNVSVLGDIHGFQFSGGGDALKLLDVVSWGNNFFMDASSTNVFYGCSNMQLSAPSNTQPVFLAGTSLLGMFAFTNFNSPLNWDLANVTSLAGMFLAANFSQPLSFSNTQGVEDTSDMFSGAVNFNSAMNLDTTNVVFMERMFFGASSFNQPVNFNTGNVQSMSGMFYSAFAFNQPINFNTSSLTNARIMFSFATNFNSPVTFTSTLKLTSTSQMFGYSGFNQPISFQTDNVQDMSWMFASATSFNQPLNFSTGKVTTMQRMFESASAFNHPINFNASSLVDASYMFYNASSFNSTVTLQTNIVEDMTRMFWGALSFNKPINFNVSSLKKADYMFANAASFNKPVVLRTTQLLRSTDYMFANATSFNSTVDISYTANVTNMNFMFFNVGGFGQSLASWNTDAVTNCSNFCEYCGLPSFPQCLPCDARERQVSRRGFVCSCFAGDYCDLCKLCQVTGSLTVDCLPPTPAASSSPSSSSFSPTSLSSSVLIISPLFNITHGDDDNGTSSSSSSFVFTLPIDPQAYTELGKVSYAHSCGSTVLSCEWQDPQSLEFQQSGCAVTKSMVDMGSGVIGTECTCSHLTVFAIALRSTRRLAPLCHASEVDYVLLSLYCVLAACLLVQLARLVWYKVYKQSTTSMLQHVLLLLACALRVAFISAKPVIGSLAGLVMLGLLPSAISLILFIYLMLAWTSLQLMTFSASPFDRFRIPFMIIAVAVLVLITALVIAVATTTTTTTTKNDNDNSSANQLVQLDVVVIGSYVLAALYAVVCALVLLAGLCLHHTFSGDTSNSPASPTTTALDWRAAFSVRVLIATMGLSSCLLASACLWAAAVQTDIIVSDAATLGTTTAFYVSDWLGLCVLTWLLSSAIAGAARRSYNKNQRESDGRAKVNSTEKL